MQLEQESQSDNQSTNIKTEFDLFDNIPNPVLIINPDGSIKYINSALEELTGYSRKEITGTNPPFPWWPEDRRPAIYSPLNPKNTR